MHARVRCRGFRDILQSVVGHLALDCWAAAAPLGYMLAGYDASAQETKWGRRGKGEGAAGLEEEGEGAEVREDREGKARERLTRTISS